MDYYFVSFKSSEVAIAALYVAAERIGVRFGNGFVNAANHLGFNQTNPTAVWACRERLQIIYRDAAGRNDDEDARNNTGRTASTAAIAVVEDDDREDQPSHQQAQQHIDTKFRCDNISPVSVIVAAADDDPTTNANVVPMVSPKERR